MTTILEPLLEPVLSEEEWQATRQQAVRKIHQVWWEGPEGCTEAEGLEIVRLGLLAREQEIAVNVGHKIATRWVNNSLFVETLELCEQVLAMFQDYRILGTIARAEQILGFVQEAVTHYQQALDLCPEQELEEKAATSNNMAEIIAQQGDVERALHLWQQSLEIYKCINDVQGTATSLHNMARVIARQGDIERALRLWEESLEIQECINDIQGKALTLNSMAGIIAQQGDIERALHLWQQSLEILERINDVRGKSATLNNMAGIIAQQGDIERALHLWQQSLEIVERINDVQSRAAIFSNMAQVIAQQGDIKRALHLWQQSLEIYESTNNIQGKAITLANWANWAGKTGDKATQLDLYLQAAFALAQVHAFSDLVTVLNNLGLSADYNSLVYLAQAVWLILRIEAPLANTIQLIVALYNKVPQADELKALLGRTALFLCYRRGEDHPQLEELQERSFSMILTAAETQEVETQEAFDNWCAQQRLNDEEYFLPRLNQRLEEIVGDEWLFDRSQVSMGG